MVPQTTLMSERTKFSSFAADWWANQALKSGPLRLCVICLQGGIFAAVQIESGLWASENLRFDGAPFLSAPRDVLMVKVFGLSMLHALLRTDGHFHMHFSTAC